MLRYGKIILLSTAVLVMCAGVVVGRLSMRLPAMPPHPGGPPSWFTDQLDLTATQRQQMDSIWDDTRQKIDKTMDGLHGHEKDRDKAIHDLLTPAQQTAYDKIIDDFHQQRAALDKERDRLIHDAEDRSRALLNDAQQKKWDELHDANQKENHEHRWPRGSTTTRSTTRPGNN